MSEETPFYKGYRPNVAVAVRDAGGRILAGRRPGLPGPWLQLPQGGIDAGESPEEALRRELREETGLTEFRILRRVAVPIRYDFPPEFLEPGGFRGQDQIYFLVEIDEAAKDRIHPSDELVDFRWLTPREVLESVVPFKREAYARALTELALI